MLLNSIEFLHKKRLSQDFTKDNKKDIGEIKRLSGICENELINKNISIITDKNLESDVVDNVCPQQQHVNATTFNSPNTSTEYVIIACEEKPVLNNTNWINVNYHKITDSIRRNSIVQKDCGSKTNRAWLPKKLHRMISKIRDNKVYPVPTNG